MCGIFGYVGNKHPKDILVQGLLDLEYRGYDSSGVAFWSPNCVQVVKASGRISQLEKKLNSTSLIDSSMGISHTRWATHGIVNEINAHPHTIGKVTLVHNGIIENAMMLKEKLIQEGVKFQSDTDSEVIAALIDYYYEEDPIQAIERALSELIGTYALIILFQNKDKLFAVRKESPLLIGVSDGEFFVGSDLLPIVRYTDRYLLLKPLEIAEISSSIHLFQHGKEICPSFQVTDMKKNVSDKEKYDHYMLKEIMEQPKVLEKMIQSYLSDVSLLPDLFNYEEVHIVACGSALYAGMIGKTLIEEKFKIPVLCECASEYCYQFISYQKKTLVILISQSGETFDTIAAMRKAKSSFVDTLAIVNVEGSTIARESDHHIYIMAGAEIAVATTKAYTLQVMVLAMLCCRLELLNHSSFIFDEIQRLPQLLRKVLDKKDVYAEIAKNIYQQEDIYFIGRRMDYAICLEGSLKLKEISYIHSDAYPAGELKHGPISLIQQGTVVIAILTDDDIFEKTLSNLFEVKARGAKVFAISNRDICELSTPILVPKVSNYFQPILVAPILQLIAYEVAKLRGCDIDKPRNLAKSVTVE